MVEIVVLILLERCPSFNSDPQLCDILLLLFGSELRGDF